MKRIIITILVSSISVYAQDVLTLKTGESVKTKITEITPTEIKYKAFDNLEGPTITIYKSDASNIKYQNGVFLDLVNIVIPAIKSPKEVAKTLTNDIVFLKNGRSIDCRVTEIKTGSIVYKSIDPNTDVTQEIDQLDINSITYKNGTSQSFTKPQQAPSSSVTSYTQPITQQPSVVVYSNQSQPTTQVQSNGNNNDLFLKGQNDARVMYKGYHGAGTGTFLTTFLLSPIWGLIPAVACSATPPNRDRFVIDNNLTTSPFYTNGYASEATRIKTQKVWKNYGIGVGAWAAAIVVLLRIATIK
jgi:hypothetical protein